MALCAEYIQFRREVDDLLSGHFEDICTRKCYESSLSACCSLEGMITHFADVVINVLFSTQEEIASLRSALNGKGREGNGPGLLRVKREAERQGAGK